MRIVQVVTLLSPDGAYGGPTTVAINQSAELAARGHDVTLAVAVPNGYRPEVPGSIELRTFGARPVGPRGSMTRIAAPGMLRWLHSAASSFDVAHVHLGRDFVSAPAARMIKFAGTPLHVQTHGMVSPRSGLPQRVIDAALVRPVIDAAESVFYLNDPELVALQGVVGADAHYCHLNNGIGVPAESADDDAEVPEVLFLGRLHKRKRPVNFARSAVESVCAGRRARFTVVGPDEGEAGAVDQLFGSVAGPAASLLAREGAVRPDQVLDRMRRASVFVLPSVDEPLGMSVLEAMSLGLPVVVTDTCGCAVAIAGAGAGLVIGDSVDDLTDAIGRLLDDPAAAREMGERGRRLVAEQFSIGAVVDELEERYRNSRREGIS